MIKLKAWNYSNSTDDKLRAIGYNVPYDGYCKLSDKTELACVLGIVDEIFATGLNVLIQHTMADIIVWVDTQRFTQR